MKSTPENRYFYDAAGQVVMTTLNNSQRNIRHLDGEGRAIRRNEYDYLTGQYHLLKTEYAIYSSVLGKELTTVKSDGTKLKTNVYGIGGTVATQNRKIFINGVVFDDVRLEHLDPARESYTETDASGFAYNLEKPAELDPLGSNVGLSSPTNQSNLAGGNSPWGDPFGGYSCRMDGFEVPCSQAIYALSIGAAIPTTNFQQAMYLGHWATDRTTEPWRHYFVPALSLFSANPNFSPTNSANPSDRKPSLDKKKQLEALKFCIDKLWNGAIILTNFKEVVAGGSLGEATFSISGGTTVYNDAKSYDTAFLTKVINVGRVHPFPAGSILGFSVGLENNSSQNVIGIDTNVTITVDGTDYVFTGRTSYTANDINNYKVPEFSILPNDVGNQIHELAHQIDLLLGLKDSYHTEAAWDIGDELTDCVQDKYKQLTQPKPKKNKAKRRKN